MDWSWAAAPPEISSRGLHTAPEAQINLRPTTREFGAYNFGRPVVPSIYGRSSTSRNGSHDDLTSHLDSQDFSGVDLGLTAEGDFSMDIEAGRDAMSNLSRQGSVGKRGASLDIVPEAGGFDMGFEGVDLGLDFGEQPELPPLEERSRRECKSFVEFVWRASSHPASALSTPPPVSPPQLVAEFTPGTAARFSRPEQPAKPKRARLLHADEELELPDEDFVAPNEDSAILAQTHYIPSDPEVVRLRSIAADPAAHFLPTVNIGGTTMIYAGPEGLAPELTELFTFPANILRRDRGQDEEAGPAAKRPRVEQTPELEAGRRGSMFPPSEHAFDTGHDFGMDILPEAGDEFALPEFATPRKEASLAPSRAESIARAIQFGGEADHPLAMFDPRRTDSQSIHETPTKSVVSETSRGGFSKNTGMAMGLLRKEIEAIEAEDKVINFNSIASGASKKAAAAFFFEMLVLGTKDCVRLEQDRAFEGIKIRSKPRLFQDLSA
jgi:cohesin complex subunit SCC1